MKIVFLGDSLTWGGYGGNFVAELAKLLPQHEIVNAGIGGNTVLNLLNRVDDVLADEPDGIFVMVGGNDAISSSQPATRRYYEQVQKVPGGIVTPEQFAQTYRDLLTRIQLAHVLAGVGLEPSEYNPETIAAVRQYNALAREAASAFNIPVLDLMTHFPPQNIQPRPPLNQADINLIGKRSSSGWNDYETEQKRGGYTFTFDGLHLMPQSASQLAQIIADFLKPYL
ncbi:MAG: SGNH/GDSL hydrolase family protein [Chloroflexota bacterium]